jgi:hypothetical protein
MKKSFLIGLSLLLAATTFFCKNTYAQTSTEQHNEKFCIDDAFEIQFSHHKIAVKYLGVPLSNATISLYNGTETVLDNIPLQARKNTFSFAQPVGEGFYLIAIKQDANVYHTKVLLSSIDQ